MSNKKDKTGIQLTRVLVIAQSGQEDLNCSVEGEDACRGGPDPGTVVVDCLGGQVDVHTGVVTNLSADNYNYYILHLLLSVLNVRGNAH